MDPWGCTETQPGPLQMKGPFTTVCHGSEISWVGKASILWKPHMETTVGSKVVLIRNDFSYNAPSLNSCNNDQDSPVLRRSPGWRLPISIYLFFTFLKIPNIKSLWEGPGKLNRSTCNSEMVSYMDSCPNKCTDLAQLKPQFSPIAGMGVNVQDSDVTAQGHQRTAEVQI